VNETYNFTYIIRALRIFWRPKTKIYPFQFVQQAFQGNAATHRPRNLRFNRKRATYPISAAAMQASSPFVVGGTYSHALIARKFLFMQTYAYSSTQRPVIPIISTKTAQNPFLFSPGRLMNRT
jgi:hypothetical protein